jgi:hypothetical protein
MGARAAVIALSWLLACTRDRPADPDPDCELVHRDPGNAAAGLTRRYPGAPVKVAEIIERCVAPSGAPCERLAKIFAVIPGLMPAGGSAVAAPAQIKELCEGMPPEMQRCMLPSYALAHAEECAKIRDAITESAKP